MNAYISTLKTTIMRFIDAFLQEFEQEMSSTRKLLQVIPFDNPDWKPHEKSFSLSALASHVAEIPGWVAVTLTTDELDFAAGNYKPFKPSSTEELLSFFDKQVDGARAALQQASDETLSKTWTLRSGDQTFFTQPKPAVLRSFCMNHLIHHRAQLTVYLRLLNVRFPGMYGPTADDPM